MRVEVEPRALLALTGDLRSSATAWRGMAASSSDDALLAMDCGPFVLCDALERLLSRIRRTFDALAVDADAADSELRAAVQRYQATEDGLVQLAPSGIGVRSFDTAAESVAPRPAPGIRPEVPTR